MKKTQKRITTLIFLLIVIFLPFITLVSKKENFSELENRVLSKKPEFSLENWFDKSFMNDFESYVSDHFLGREKWITKKIDIMEKNNMHCLQKVGIVRYNAFSDTGSDLCFALALLDFENNAKNTLNVLTKR